MVATRIIEPAITQLVSDGRAKVAELREAEEACRKVEKKLGETREAANMRRIELGALLLKVRAMYPRRGTAEAGWKAYLESIEVDDSTAHRYMEMARSPRTESTATSQDPIVRRSEGDPGPDAPPPSDGDAPAELLDSSPRETQVTGRNLEPGVDRNTWCTPEWITKALGKVDLDPCWNERATVQAARTFALSRGENGLALAGDVDAKAKVFINPPYDDVWPWIKAYAHVRFVFLLKFDPSTKWFAELIENTELVLFPRGTRVEFVAPEGVEHSGSNPFPHALYFARAKDAPKALLDSCFRWDVE